MGDCFGQSHANHVHRFTWENPKVNLACPSLETYATLMAIPLGIQQNIGYVKTLCVKHKKHCALMWVHYLSSSKYTSTCCMELCTAKLGMSARQCKV